MIPPPNPPPKKGELSFPFLGRAGEGNFFLTTTSDDFSEIEKLNYQRLPKEKIKKLDGHYMLIELSKEEMKLLLYIDFQ